VDTTTALAVLNQALDRCRNEDVRTPEVFAALDFLAASATVKWPFEQFRRELLNDAGSLFADQEGHWQVLNASLNGIKLAISGALPEPTREQKRDWVFEAPVKRPSRRG
jgi:hypothetical protein